MWSSSRLKTKRYLIGENSVEETESPPGLGHGPQAQLITPKELLEMFVQPICLKHWGLQFYNFPRLCTSALHHPYDKKLFFQGQNYISLYCNYSLYFQHTQGIIYNCSFYKIYLKTIIMPFDLFQTKQFLPIFPHKTCLLIQQSFFTFSHSISFSISYRWSESFSEPTQLNKNCNSGLNL